MTRMNSSGMARWLLAVALGTLLVEGCAGAQKKEATFSATGSYAFKLTFDANGCPVSAEPDLKNCRVDLAANDPGQPRSCVRVKRGESVSFDAPAGTGFLVQFDPFKKGTFKPNAALTIDTQLYMGPPKDKKFTFNVLADPPGTCPPLDPEIVVN